MYMEAFSYSDVIVFGMPCVLSLSNILLVLCTDNRYDLQYGSMLWYSEQQGSHIDAHTHPISG